MGNNFHPSVTVLGSVNADTVLRTPRLPRKGETVQATEMWRFWGGKGANQAVAASRAGVRTRLVASVGDDAAGREALRFLNDNSVDTSAVGVTQQQKTGTAFILVSQSGENLIVTLPGANATTKGGEVGRTGLSERDVLLCQFEIPLEAVQEALLYGRSRGARTVLNPAPAVSVSYTYLSSSDVIVLNETELCTLVGKSGAEPLNGSEALKNLGELARNLPASILIVTLGERGGMVHECGETYCYKPHQVAAVDSTGAGDCFAGSLAACLAQGESVRSAVTYANAAASICVQRRGAAQSMPSRHEVLEQVTKSESLVVVKDVAPHEEGAG